jgi:hypothetical protein
VVAVAEVGAPGGGDAPGRVATAGLHVASIQPGPTCDQGMSPMVASALCGAACATAVDVGGAGLSDGACTAVEPLDAEHPAAVSAASETAAHKRRQWRFIGCWWREMWFITARMWRTPWRILGVESIDTEMSPMIAKQMTVETEQLENLKTRHESQP